MLLRTKWPLLRFSSVYRSAPLLKTDQEAFLNAVGRFETYETPDVVQLTLTQVEESLGKNILERFGPRTIDLDLLLYGDGVMKSDQLVIPHPRMHERRFVLEPLLELIDLNDVHPILNKTYPELLQDVKTQQCERIDLAL